MDSFSIICYILTLTFIVCGFVNPKGKLLFFVESCWLIIVTSGNNFNVDWTNTELIYNQVSTSSTSVSPLFDVITKYVSSFGLEFQSLNFMLSLASCVLIIFVVKKYSDNQNVVLSLLFIYPFIENIIQMRFFYGFGYVLLGLCIFIFTSKNKFKNNLLLVVLILIASQFHKSFLIFLTVPLFFLLPKNLKIALPVGFLVVGTIFRYNLIFLTSIFKSDFITEKLQFYYLNSGINSSAQHYVFWLVWQLVQFFLVYLVYSRDKENSTMSNLMFLNLWSLFIVPMYSFDLVFTRIFRVVMIVNYIAFSRRYSLKKGELSLFDTKIMLVQFAMSFLIFYVTTAQSAYGFETMVLDVFKNNFFLN